MSQKALALVFASMLAGSVFAQQQPGQPAAADKDKAAQKQTGEAMVVTRDGPSIALEGGQQPIIAVAFPGKQEGLEVSVLVANPSEGAKAKEVVFESRNANNGMVVYNGDQNLTGAQTAAAAQPAGQPGAKDKQTQLIFTARQNGKPVQVTELANQGQARILIVKRGADEAQAKAAQPGQPQPAAAQQSGKAQAEANDAVIFVYLKGEQAK